MIMKLIRTSPANCLRVTEISEVARALREVAVALVAAKPRI